MDKLKLKKFQKELISQNLILKTNPSLYLSTSSSKNRNIFPNNTNFESDIHIPNFNLKINNKFPISNSTASLELKRNSNNFLNKNYNPGFVNAFTTYDQSATGF